MTDADVPGSAVQVSGGVADTGLRIGRNLFPRREPRRVNPTARAPLQSSAKRGALQVFIDGVVFFCRRRLVSRAARFALRGCLWPRLTVAWLRHIEATPAMRGYASCQPNVVDKIHRPYVSKDFPARRRLALLMEHYAFIDASPLRQGLWASLQGRLPAVPCGTGGVLKLFMRGALYSKEGEYELCLESGNGGRLCTVTFLIAVRCGRPTLLIGGLQGSAPGARDVMRRTSAALARLPVKQFMTRVAVGVARGLGITDVRAIDDAKHIYQSWRYRRKHESVKACYASTWTALGGSPDGNGFWQLHYPGAGHGTAQSRHKAEVADAASAALLGALRACDDTRYVNAA